MEEKDIIPNFIINKINNDYKNYSIFNSTDDIIRCESDDYRTYFYDNVIFCIRDTEVCIDRYYYKKTKKTEIIYTYFGDYIDGDENNERESIEIIKTSARYKILTPNEIHELKTIFFDETSDNILTIFDISRKISNFVKKKCKQENINFC